MQLIQDPQEPIAEFRCDLPLGKVAKTIGVYQHNTKVYIYSMIVFALPIGPASCFNIVFEKNEGRGNLQEHLRLNTNDLPPPVLLLTDRLSRRCIVNLSHRDMTIRSPSERYLHDVHVHMKKVLYGMCTEGGRGP